MSYDTLCGYQVRLLPVAGEHIEQMRQWRNSEHVRQQMLSTDDISKKQQREWFSLLPKKHNERHYVIQYKERLIGACNIKSHPHKADITTSKAYEMGLYIGDTDYMGNIIAFSPTLLLNDYCFDVLEADYLYAVVKSTNHAALRYNEKLGYREKKAGDLIELTLNKSDYETSTRPLKMLLNRPRK